MRGLYLGLGLLVLASTVEATHVSTVSASANVFACVGQVRAAGLNSPTSFGAFVYRNSENENEYEWYGTKDEESAFLRCMESRGNIIIKNQK